MAVLGGKQADIEQALRKSEERFRLVVESAPNAMVMVGPSGRIEMVNARAEQVYGYERAELLGKPAEILMPERYRNGAEGLREIIFANPGIHRIPGRTPGTRDLCGLRKDGSEFPIELSLSHIETDEGTMMLSAIVDISDRKQKEESIQAVLAEKDALLGEIHHRVKNNLQIILSLLVLQSSRIKDDTALAMVRASQDRIRSMAIIHQTLYESKNFAKVDFRSFLDRLLPNLTSSYDTDAERISITVVGEDVLLPINAAIPCGLLANELVSNALKHGFPDGSRGEVLIALAKDGEDRIMLSVSDNGVGLPDHIDPDSGKTLGLQLVHLLTDQLGGEMAIARSNPTRFVLHFPIGR